MKPSETYSLKFDRISGQTLFHALPTGQQAFLRAEAGRYRLTLQELRQLCEIAQDFNMWGTPGIQELWPHAPENRTCGREAKKELMAHLRERWEALRNAPTLYSGSGGTGRPPERKLQVLLRDKGKPGLGFCPVASERTLCCNLLTLDAIDNCGFDCSYCSIQSFFQDDKVYFNQGFAEKLQALELDPERLYHIGTGQSSDSLLWGNRHGVLDALTAFARANPNVILELKTKSKNVGYLLEHEVPANVICTWSLNTPVIIAHEEHRTASLDDRLMAARQVADRGILVGFHLHPMVHYDHWRRDYSGMFSRMQEGFRPSEVALVSLGTLTYTKSVMRQIRSRGVKSRILQLPLVASSGKFSYPEAIKQEMFAHAYNGLGAWHDEVFFYLCMEERRLWRPVFGYDYPSNETFEAAMKACYKEKIRQAEVCKIHCRPR